MAGLLHDIGRLVLVTGFPISIKRQSIIGQSMIARCWRPSARYCHAIMRPWGMRWQNTGAFLRPFRWRLPGTIRQTQQWSGGLTNLVHVADAMVHALDLVCR